MSLRTAPVWTALSTLVIALAPRLARACDPMPPHLADAVPAADAVDVPRGAALIVRVPLLSPASARDVGLTVDGVAYTPRIERVDYGPAVNPQVFRDGALLALWLPDEAPAGLAVYTFPDVISEETWSTAAHPLRVVEGAAPPLRGPPRATGTLGPDTREDHGTCGWEEGRLLTVDATAEGAVAAVLWVEEGDAEVPVTAAFFEPGAADLRLVGLVEGDRAEACWVVEAWGPAGDRVRGERTCTPTADGGADGADGADGTDGTDGADGSDGSGGADGDGGADGAGATGGASKGGCAAPGVGVTSAWALAVAVASALRRRR